MSDLTLRQILELPQLRELDPRADEERAEAFQRTNTVLRRVASQLLDVEVCAAVYVFAPAPEPWTWQLEQAVIGAANE